MTGITLLTRAQWGAHDGAPPPLKRASLGGRALVALATRTGPHPEGTGLYQALGHEKLELTERFYAHVREKGFAGMKATAPVLEYSGYGAFTSLALELKLSGPFWTLESDARAGAAALQQAACDLRLFRCPRALVGSCTHDGRAWLLVLEPTQTPRFTLEQSWRTTDADAGAVRPSPDDLHGLGALSEALEHGERGRAASVLCQTPSGRSVLTRCVPTVEGT